MRACDDDVIFFVYNRNLMGGDETKEARRELTIALHANASDRLHLLWTHPSASLIKWARACCFECLHYVACVALSVYCGQWSMMASLVLHHSTHLCWWFTCALSLSQYCRRHSQYQTIALTLFSLLRRPQTTLIQSHWASKAWPQILVFPFVVKLDDKFSRIHHTHTVVLFKPIVWREFVT